MDVSGHGVADEATALADAADRHGFGAPESVAAAPEYVAEDADTGVPPEDESDESDDDDVAYADVETVNVEPAPTEEAPAEEPVAVGWDGPFGAGSADANEDGSGPEGWTVKAAKSTKVYLTPEIGVYDQAKANVWFIDEQRAQDAGFRRWDQAKS